MQDERSADAKANDRAECHEIEHLRANVEVVGEDRSQGKQNTHSAGRGETRLEEAAPQIRWPPPPPERSD